MHALHCGTQTSVPISCLLILFAMMMPLSVCTWEPDIPLGDSDEHNLFFNLETLVSDIHEQVEFLPKFSEVHVGRNVQRDPSTGELLWPLPSIRLSWGQVGTGSWHIHVNTKGFTQAAEVAQKLRAEKHVFIVVTLGDRVVGIERKPPSGVFELPAQWQRTVSDGGLRSEQGWVTLVNAKSRSVLAASSFVVFEHRAIYSVSVFEKGAQRLLNLGGMWLVDEINHLSVIAWNTAHEKALFRLLDALLPHYCGKARQFEQSTDGSLADLPHVDFLDVGAGMGMYTVYAATEGCTVLPIEPQPQCNRFLNLQLQLNAVSTALVQPIEKPTMASDVVTDTTRVPVESSCVSHFQTSPLWSVDKFRIGEGMERDDAQCVDVISERIDRAVLGVSIMRIDTSGGEFAVLRGAWDLFQRRSVAHVLVHITPGLWHAYESHGRLYDAPPAAPANRDQESDAVVDNSPDDNRSTPVDNASSPLDDDGSATSMPRTPPTLMEGFESEDQWGVVMSLEALEAVTGTNNAAREREIIGRQRQYKSNFVGGNGNARGGGGGGDDDWEDDWGDDDWFGEHPQPTSTTTTTTTTRKATSNVDQDVHRTHAKPTRTNAAEDHAVIAGAKWLQGLLKLGYRIVITQSMARIPNLGNGLTSIPYLSKLTPMASTASLQGIQESDSADDVAWSLLADDIMPILSDLWRPASQTQPGMYLWITLIDD